ncbi:protein RETICULATA-RELATED 5, chloroplastic [Physcomitrium patens]|uniref:Haem-binding uptake Tiki superfamily ChaN domain-containing protein n=1 Tax=Physcomitrium patens TaxID=3218 RepID=A0A2K1K5R9_PHYPA|nr:protein RETICULATA-RELATED 5, chloroplastic-like [Physcomitrium patens]XP_024382483.1 protein RETICULATA-RELATED 5, chloroplastic-like [Physcomitrium patens]XP_024382485.1 protein RETICULATA-RELATED 5, chloroplastic-like [Physcomitrium patens]XP_024382486.1 protein RETICULATA-RELATED 5, chloroplastic-like [Physcomitrium patens]PNR49125.1 hypothetical protein PHYPA_011021 [Physcomitrium patens]|eukprot:XP_024382482.1 protein RETICULATA-RELATED 5, chloroplastic-like [Physcomitrella patens]
MAGRIGTPSPLLKSSAVVSAQKQVRLSDGASRIQFSLQVVKFTHQNSRLQRTHTETQFALKKIRFLVGKRLSIASNAKLPRRHVAVASSFRCNEGSDVDTNAVVATELGACQLGSDDHGVTEAYQTNQSRSARSNDAEFSNVHLGRRMLLGSVLTAVALSSINNSGLALAEVKSSGSDKAKTKGGASGAEKGKNDNAGPQIRDKWKGSRVYDATVLGEPVAVGGERSRVWQKLLQARVVYLGEAERVPDPDDKILEMGIVRKLRDACFEQARPVSLALDIFPVTLQKSLDKYMSKRLSDAELKSMVEFWPNGRWQECFPILQYCRASGVRLLACGTPAEVLRKIQANGFQGLSEKEKKTYVPPVGGGFGGVPIPLIDQLALADVASNPYGSGPYQYSQARIVADHVMSQVVEKGMLDGGSTGLLIVITGASHVAYGSRGTGLPARVQKKLTKRTQAVVLLNPERQRIRKEGNVPEADFLWYSAARACNRNCFDRAEVARVMDAAGRRRDALPQDIQAGLERGLVDPEVLKSFFELDEHPIIAELTRRFQGLRERWLADPRFLQRLAIEESISITTTLLAQYERRGPRFWNEIEYVITDSVRGAVVDFFTVWLPAPTLSFRSLDAEVPGGFFEGLTGLLGTVPDNAFQRARVGESYDLKARALAVVLGGLKLFGVGFISSIGTLSVSNGVWAIRKTLNREIAQKPAAKRSPIFKTAFVYGSFLGLSANLRYQAIAGIVEHWIADYFLAAQPLAGSVLSFAARIANSYWGTGQWVDLARLTGLQSTEDEGPPPSPIEGQESKIEGSLEANLSSTWEQPSSPLESTDGVEVKQEVETTSAP